MTFQDCSQTWIRQSIYQPNFTGSEQARDYGECKVIPGIFSELHTIRWFITRSVSFLTVCSCDFCHHCSFRTVAVHCCMWLEENCSATCVANFFKDCSVE